LEDKHLSLFKKDFDLLVNLKKKNLFYIFGLSLIVFFIFIFMLLIIEYMNVYHNILSMSDAIKTKEINTYYSFKKSNKIHNKITSDIIISDINSYSLRVISVKKVFYNKKNNTYNFLLRKYRNARSLSFADFIISKLFYNDILYVRISSDINKNISYLLEVSFKNIDKAFNLIILVALLTTILLLVGLINFLGLIYKKESLLLKSIVEDLNFLGLNLYDPAVYYNKNISELEKIKYFFDILISHYRDDKEIVNNSIKKIKQAIWKMDIVIPFSKKEKELLYKKDILSVDMLEISEILLKKSEFLKQLFLFKTEIEREVNVKSAYQKIKEFLENVLNIDVFVLFEVNVFKNYRRIKALHGINQDEIICLKSVNSDINLCKAIRSEISVVSDKKYKKCNSCNMNRFKKFGDNYSVICIPFSINKEWDLEVQIYLNNTDINIFVDNEQEKKDDNEQKEEYINLLINYVYSILFFSKNVFNSLYLKEKLENYSYKDGLTQLYNRRFLETKILDHLNDVDSYCVIIFDIDHFKNVNDTYGHDNGDLILKEFANILNSFANNKENQYYAVRFGGEEFVLIMLNENYSFAFSFAQRIKERFASKIFNFGQGVSSFTVSGGISCFNKKEDYNIKDFYSVLKEADQALYYSKRNGRNKITLWKDIKQLKVKKEKEND